MNFKLNWRGRILLFLMFMLGGCTGGCYTQRDVDAGTRVYADIRAHDYNPRYVYTEYPELWPLVNNSAGLLYGTFALGSPNGMIIGEASHPAWVYEDTLRHRMYPEWIGRYIIENNLDLLQPHVPLTYIDDKDLVRQLRQLKQDHFADVRNMVQ